MVAIGGAHRGNETRHYEVLETFDNILLNTDIIRKLTVLAIDDYSQFFFNEDDRTLSSLTSYYPIVHLLPLEADEIESSLAALKKGNRGPSAARLAKIAARVQAVSGGHAGLVQELVDELGSADWPSTEAQWEDFERRARSGSHVLREIERSLQVDRVGFSETALRYRDWGMPEANTPRVALLRQFGVLQTNESLSVRLFAGSIAALVERIAEASRDLAPDDGTMVRPVGPRLWQRGRIPLTPDDLVIVHISDLHVSREHYRFRFVAGDVVHLPDEPSADEVLGDDLEGLGLLDRIDGLVISGDFVWSGSDPEFRRSRQVVKDIVTRLGLSSDKVLLIPGNHDVDWDPGDMATRSVNTDVSREAFDDFLQYFGQRADDFQVLRLTSRSGNNRLRIVGLDSNRVEGPRAPGIGFVAKKTLESANRELKKDHATSEASPLFTWLAVHHHVFPASSTPLDQAREAKSLSVLANAPQVLEYANDWRAELILHGHEHQQSVTSSHAGRSTVGLPSGPSWPWRRQLWCETRAPRAQFQQPLLPHLPQAPRHRHPLPHPLARRP